MSWEIEIIRWLQNSSSRPLDYIFLLITCLGTEIVFMAAVMVFYWCINKKEGFKLVNLFMVSQVMTGIIKVMVRRTRPYATGKVEAILQETDGYSFPSGHSKNIAVVGTYVSLWSRKSKKFPLIASASAILVLLVMLSRMYLGQHYLTDVLVGMAIGLAVTISGYFLFDLLGDKEEKLMYFIVPCCAVLFAVSLIMLLVKGETFDSVIKISGTYMAASIGYFLEKRKLGSEVPTSTRNRALRLLLGGAWAIAIYFGLKFLFGLCDNLAISAILDFIRYFALGIWVTLLAPLTFVKLKI